MTFWCEMFMGRFCLSTALLCIGKCYGESLIPIQKCRSCKVKQNHGSQNSNQHSTIRWQNQHKHTENNCIQLFITSKRPSICGEWSQNYKLHAIIRAVSLSTISWINFHPELVYHNRSWSARKMNLNCYASDRRFEWNEITQFMGQD